MVRRLYNRDLLALGLWTLLITLFVYLIPLSYLATGFLYFAVPTFYLVIKKPQLAKKVFVVAAFATVLSVCILSYLAHRDGAWYNPAAFGVRVLDAYPLDDFVWGFFYFSYIFAFYEYFLEREKKLVIPRKFKLSAKIITAGALIFSFVAYVYPKGVYVPYFYAWLIFFVLLFVPGVLLYYHPKIITKLLKVCIFFFFVCFLYEYVVNLHGIWLFPGSHFLGYINFLSVRYPLEEFLWTVVAAPAIITFYEFLADDNK